MTTILCTLYNSLYLDKGLVLYDSLCMCAKEFKLYVLCMDDKCYEVLTDLKQEYHIPIRLSDFEAGDEALIEAKGNRPMGEYCWTCSSSLIRYVLKHYNENCCTYIDADMYFYNDPQVLIDEMLESGKSVMVVPHRFPAEKKELAQKVGRYCVEFNTFRNTPEALLVLEYWREKCLVCCSNLGDGVHWGDQKYLEELVEKYNCVHVCENLGAGVAPWNILSYSPSIKNDAIVYNPTTQKALLYFYHFQSVTYIFRKLIDVGLGKEVNKIFIDVLYKPYLKKIDNVKQFLFEKYDINLLIHKHPTSHSRMSWLKENKIGKVLLYLRRLKQGRVIVRI